MCDCSNVENHAPETHNTVTPSQFTPGVCPTCHKCPTCGQPQMAFTWTPWWNGVAAPVAPFTTTWVNVSY